MSGGEGENNEVNDNKYLDEEEERDDATRAAEESAAREAARKRCYKHSDPPKVYTDVKVSRPKIFPPNNQQMDIRYIKWIMTN